MNHDVVKPGVQPPRFANNDRVVVAKPGQLLDGKAGIVTGVFRTRLGVNRLYVTLDSGARIVLADTHFTLEASA